jgi:hypothetical protein
LTALQSSRQLADAPPPSGLRQHQQRAPASARLEELHPRKRIDQFRSLNLGFLGKTRLTPKILKFAKIRATMPQNQLKTPKIRLPLVFRGRGIWQGGHLGFADLSP